eukprot:6177294-Pleurochrysis_carterae.AAC.5
MENYFTRHTKVVSGLYGRQSRVRMVVCEPVYFLRGPSWRATGLWHMQSDCRPVGPFCQWHMFSTLFNDSNSCHTLQPL